MKYLTPNVSGRMDNLRAAILRPQLADLPAQCARWNALYGVLEDGLAGTPGLKLIPRPEEEAYVASSFQFLLPDWPADKVRSVIARAAARGVELKWFGHAEPTGFTSRHDSWRYAPRQSLPHTDRILAGLVDMRLPLTFSTEDAALIARIIRSEVSAVFQGAADAPATVPAAD